LKYAELWGYGADFIAWVEKENVFCSTLVDRINTGYPKGETLPIDYEDKMLNTSEYFHLWVIETDYDLGAELPFDKAGLNVIITENELEKYRTRKVRILNGAHTSLVPYALLSGFDTVKSCTDDDKMYAYLRKCIFEEIIPTLDLPRAVLEEYAESVLSRFKNPYIKHYLSSIALNSVSKFKVRVLPSILEYKARFGTYPPTLLFAFAKLLAFYKTDMANDLPEVVAFMKSHSAAEILANTDLWGEDLSDLLPEVTKYENS
jgi:tagaturonate reductase